MTKTTTYALRYGELALKGRNQDRFVSDLIRIVTPRVKPLGGSVEKQHKRLVVHCDAEPQKVREALSTVFGLTSISPMHRSGRDMEDMIETAWRLVQPYQGSGKTFAVKARRAAKSFRYTSPEIQKEVAHALFQKGLDLKVNLSNPDLTLGIQVDLKKTWMYLETWPGLGGLPVDPRTLHGLLLSGGIDSPVAGNLIQKRGGKLAAIYFHTPPFTVEAAREKVIDLASVLARYQDGLNLYVVHFTELMKTLRAECDPRYMVILTRRFMMRAASQILKKIGGQSIVTGESLGQVASQTIENITAINENVPYPILRPLIGMDKLEIIDRSRKIDAYDISIRPFEDCCSLFSPKEPITRAKLHIVHEEEARLDIDGMVAHAVELTDEIPL